MRSDSSEYQKGYYDGMNDTYANTGIEAYYAGVGYGKKEAGDSHLGFNSDEERRQFEAGIQNKGKHFRAYRAEVPSFFERLFGGKRYRKEDAIGTYKKHRARKINNYVKNRRKSRKYKRGGKNRK